MKFLIALLFISTFAHAETKLLLVGGGKRPAEALKQFAEFAGGKNSNILVFSWASSTTEGADNIKAELQNFETGSVEVVPSQLSAKEITELKVKIQSATGIFFSGGDQNKLMSLIKRADLKALLKQKFGLGTIFGGTSAGTAIMSDPMLTGKGDLSVIDGTQIELAEGLGLLPPHYIVDQHFIIRSRFNRLAGVILNQDQKTGIAVDENTSLLIQGSEAQVIGPSQVMIFKKTSENTLNVSIIQPGRNISL